MTTPEQAEGATRPGAILSASSVNLAYGGVHAVIDVDLSVQAGEVHGLIGPNGAGKTSFIDAITGFERPTSGSVSFKGDDISNWPAARRVHAGIVRTFQNLELFRDLSLYDNLLVARIPSRPVDLQEVIEPFGLSAYLGQPVQEMSHGQRRLASIARAMMTGPTVLILDEPGAGLDSDETRALSEALKEIASRGPAILLVDHDMGLVLSTCDRVTVLDNGCVLATGSPDAIRANDEVRRAYLGV
jgi:branched-chain amino acid transport system ATP-binding protein